jgi:hypothetical protein
MIDFGSKRQFIMNKLSLIRLLILTAIISSCNDTPDNYHVISQQAFKDKIAGGWAGKMIGVTYGAPTEFAAQGKIFADSIRWLPADIKGSLWQDDLYVQLTFLMTMDQYGIGAPARKFQEMLAKAGYPLWHANVQARKNYYDSIFPPASGSPQYNIHADDIDFQIEADYIGFMCPGMPQQVTKLCDKIGHIMNFGDGVYGGIFVAALYAEAFFEDDIPVIIDNALKSIPAESEYAAIIKDVVLLHSQYPADWPAAWKKLEVRWGNTDICGAGNTFNIDAKLNGAYIVMGLLYGDGDPKKTLEISTRCGQDSDCNPSNALAVLGVMKGFSGLPDEMKNGIAAISDSTFINTNYTFNKAVESTYTYALDLIKANSGKISGNEIRIKKQNPVAPKLEIAFPNVVFDHRVSIFNDSAWKFSGSWHTYQLTPWGKKKAVNQSRFAERAGDEVIFTFNGTGIALIGNWVRDGGKADVYLDGKFHKTIDSYFFWNNQEHNDISLWHIVGLEPGDHSVKLVLKGDKRPESTGTRVYISEALIFHTAPKVPV